ncbi:hypothetical protein PRIPAC_86388 [Pristionchus pacificus]|uniref:Uncharacterized protein n=1 Tax=Pristionchus pacificus TaxID=54126 RepID=A0A2A6CEU1_PRIPA|nr:hypothetical protein PRIPAC_86388 [Pristionchus pacificus]|eukprot:PDM76620.1 hypothetical protein PRIPAC_42986 [Pristionchus pacificus]
MNNTTKYKLVPMVALNKDEATLDQMQNELLSVLRAPNLSSLEKRMIYEDLLKRVHNFKLNLDGKIGHREAVNVDEREYEEGPQEEQQQPIRRREPLPAPENDDYDDGNDYFPPQLPVFPPRAVQADLGRAQRDDSIPRFARGNIQKRAKGQRHGRRAPLHPAVVAAAQAGIQQQQQLQGHPAVPHLPPPLFQQQQQQPQPPPFQQQQHQVQQQVAQAPVPPPVAFVPVPPVVVPRVRPAKRGATNDGDFVRLPPARDLFPPNRAPRYPPPAPSRKRVLNAPIGPPPRPLPFVRNLTTRKRGTPRDILPRLFGQPRSKRPHVGGGRLRVKSWL